MRQHLPSIVLLTLLANENVASGQLQGIAEDHLNRAKRLANAFNWTDAGPHFREAARLLGLQGDAKLVYQSKLGVMRSTTANLVIPAVLLKLEDDLRNLPFLQTDRRLRMFCLIVKGDFDGESDHSAMERDWGEVHRLARELGDEAWQNRALAQLGIAAFYNGDLEGARERVGKAMLEAHRIGDKPGEMVALSFMAHGLNLTRLFNQALPIVDRAIKLAKEDPDIGYPYVALETKLVALIGTGQLEAAQRLVDEMLLFARKSPGGA
ncbi:MAG: hypothetical protein ABI693_33330, partial [Bryobacteraceae bacterium]